MAKTNPEAPMIKQGKWKYTWHMMKTNKACYAMLLANKGINWLLGKYLD